MIVCLPKWRKAENFTRTAHNWDKSIKMFTDLQWDERDSVLGFTRCLMFLCHVNTYRSDVEMFDKRSRNFSELSRKYLLLLRIRINVSSVIRDWAPQKNSIHNFHSSFLCNIGGLKPFIPSRNSIRNGKLKFWEYILISYHFYYM